MSRYAIGVDYGTESARAVVVDVATGNILASAVEDYPDGVIEDVLPRTDVKLEKDWALQNPNDYVHCFVETVRRVLKDTAGKVNVEEIVGIGIDFTSCTILPVKEDGMPLCNIPALKDNPHSWVKLWKHHAAQDEANRLNAIAEKLDNTFLNRYGGKISSEWAIPKLWQIVNEAPEIYDEMDRFVEAADWIVWQLVGKEMRNSCTAGYKAIWHKREGYPFNSFFRTLDSKLDGVIGNKLSSDIYPQGTKAGGLTKTMAERTGLLEGTAVAVGNVDAHVSAPPAGVVSPGVMLLIMGTSTCNIVLAEEEKHVPGMCGVVEDGVIPGYFGYVAGQPAVGDSFAWFVEHAVPEEDQREAAERGISIHELFEERAARLAPGENGLIALDWLNGNRSVLVDVDLSSMLVGLTLDTKSHEIYRALIEATAFGQRLIIENFREHGVPVHEIVACGGLPFKNKMLMQIYADVLDMDIRIAAHLQTPAVGSAMFGAVAAGSSGGGYDTIQEAAAHMAQVQEDPVQPIQENVVVYDQLYAEYKRLHDYFGRGGNNVMKVLHQLKQGQASE